MTLKNTEPTRDFTYEQENNNNLPLSNILLMNDYNKPEF